MPGYPVLAFFFFPSFDHTVPFLKKLHSFLTFYFIDFFNIINQNNPVPMLTETFNIVGAQGNFLKFVRYFILLYVFIYFKLNELFLKKNYDNDLGVDIFGASDIRSGYSSNSSLMLRDGDGEV